MAMLFLLCGFGFTLACSSQSGGVDGSGGNLRKIEYSAYSSYVTQFHRFFVKDVAFRIALIAENSPEDFFLNTERWLQFIGNDLDEFVELVDRVKFVPRKDWCESVDHPEGVSDAAINSKNEVCLSYPAFQNFDHMDFIRKAVILTFHELAHLRGFDEVFAKSIQADLEGEVGLGSKVLLVNSDQHERFWGSFREFSNFSAQALVEIVNTESSTVPAKACSYLGASLIQSLGVSLPKYLNDRISFLQVTLRSLEGGCRNLDKVDLANQISNFLGKVLEFSEMYRSYAFRNCQNLCTPTRFHLGGVESALSYWKIKRALILGRIDAKTKMENVACRLLNEDTNEFLDFRPVDENSYKDTFFEVGHNGIDVVSFERGHSSIGPTIQVSLRHNGAMEVLSSTGSVFSEATAFAGLVQEGVSQRFSIRFAHMEGHEGKGLPYSLKGPIFNTIRLAPQIKERFELNCQLDSL
jgi:hypothetical protein